MGNVSSIKKLPKYKKSIITFDKKGNRKEQIIEKDDLYLVTLNNGDELALTKKQIDYYNVNNEENSIDFDDDLIETVDNSQEIGNNNTLEQQNVQNNLPVIKTVSQVINSPINEE